MRHIFHRKTVRARISRNPLGDILQRYMGYLESRGYKLNNLHQYVFAVEHFGKWLGVGAINHESVERFIEHLQRCRCEKPAPCYRPCVRAALNCLLKMLCISRPGRSVYPVVGRLLREYENHLLAVAGLSESTIHYRIRYARNLLLHFELQRLGELKSWLPTEVADYIASTGRHWKPGSGQLLASSARSFIRFLLIKGFVRRDLAAAIPSFANWRLARLPAVVSRNDLEKLLKAIDASTPVGMRDRGALLCMIELGLRASDVTAITIDGVDLNRNVLRLKHTKGRRINELPMTRRLSLALRQYILRGRPYCESHELFVIHRAPIGQPLKPIGIRGIVVRYAAIAGLVGSIRGTHVIRHSVASSLINNGASIKDIADLLGHRSIDTTAIYAKIDLSMLARVAMPWPGACL